jgi:hypothetical protein
VECSTSSGLLKEFAFPLYHIPIPKQTDLPISCNIAPSQKVLTTSIIQGIEFRFSVGPNIMRKTPGLGLSVSARCAKRPHPGPQETLQVDQMASMRAGGHSHGSGANLKSWLCGVNGQR